MKKGAISAIQEISGDVFCTKKKAAATYEFLFGHNRVFVASAQGDSGSICERAGAPLFRTPTWQLLTDAFANGRCHQAQSEVESGEVCFHLSDRMNAMTILRDRPRFTIREAGRRLRTPTRAIQRSTTQSSQRAL
jgi:hypothetical protein